MEHTRAFERFEAKQRPIQMSQETSATESTTQVTIKSESKTRNHQITVQEVMDSLKSVQDDIGQITELTSEEESLVREFLASLVKLIQPLATTVSVSTSALPDELGVVSTAHMDPTGHLAIVYQDGHVELKDLSKKENRDLLVDVVQDTIPKFKQLTTVQRRKIENRMKFLSSITKEVKKISKTLSAIETEEPHQ
jgi:hypothetical protein